MREFSFRAMLLGVIVGTLLAMANAYVGLKVGMTVSASIPAAVISMAVLRGMLTRGTILENNIVQTIGSAGQSLAAGIIFTVPAMFMLGGSPVWRDIVIWSGIGGVLGACFMVPLRRVLIVREHGKLPFPEGVACAEVLESGERGGVQAGKVFGGVFIAGLLEIVRQLGAWADSVVWSFAPRNLAYRTQFQLSCSPALLGVGYILGAKVAGWMLGGALLGWCVLVPAILFFGADNPSVVWPASTLRLADMTPADVYKNYVKYIGAGAVAMGGLISLFKSSRVVFSSVFQMISSALGRGGKPDRTDRDLPLPLLILLIAGLGYLMWRSPQAHVGRIGAIAVILASFVFVAISSRLVGFVGSSSNPISGMTVGTLIATSFAFVHFGVGTGADAKLAALAVAAIVCCAIGVAGDTSQDLKTGFLVKATPWKQQVGILVGVVTSCSAVAWVMLLLQRTYGFGGDSPLLAPQAGVMKLIVEGVMDANLPWMLLMTGAAIAIVTELCGVAALPVAVGLYLPMGVSTPLMVGGILRWLTTKIRRTTREGEDPGVLTASGFVAAEGLVGIATAGAAALVAYMWKKPEFMPSNLTPWLWRKLGWEEWSQWRLETWAYDLLPLAPFALLILWLLVSALRRAPIVLEPLPSEAGAARSGRFSMLPTPDADKPA